jgi:hypothetical protein
MKAGDVLLPNSEQGSLFVNMWNKDGTENVGKRINLKRESKMEIIIRSEGKTPGYIHNLDQQFPDLGVLDDGKVTLLANTGPNDDWAKIGDKVNKMIDKNVPLNTELDFYVDFDADLTKARKSAKRDELGNFIYTKIGDSKLDIKSTGADFIVVGTNSGDVKLHFIQKAGGSNW